MRSLFRDVLFWHKLGPIVVWRPRDGVFCASGLTTGATAEWGMSRLDILRLGVRCIRVALFNWGKSR